MSDQTRERERGREPWVSRALLPWAGLVGIYLLVLTSLRPGDVLVGGLLAALVVVATRRIRGGGVIHRRLDAHRLLGAPALVVRIVADTAVGTWRAVRFCLRPDAASTGLVEVPAGSRSGSGLAAWGFITGLAPDELVVEIDEERRVLLVHVLDADDPDAVQARHADAEERQGQVFG
jgi:multicomponent Na+:H+ antiporter subunit E